MDNNIPNPNTGAKGTFPINEGPPQEVSMPTLRPEPPTNAPTPAAPPAAPPSAPAPAPVVPGVPGVPGPPVAAPAAPAVPPTPMATPDDTSTFMSLQTVNEQNEVSGILEIDLVSFRVKGEESRYLSINTTGASENGDQSIATLSITNETDFNRFKEFISKLNWND